LYATTLSHALEVKGGERGTVGTVDTSVRDLLDPNDIPAAVGMWIISSPTEYKGIA
jgi:hypothetical protein